MANEEYQKRFEEWKARQEELERQKEAVRDYKPSQMKVRAPLGCLLAIAALLLAVVYFLAAHAAKWKSWLS